MLLSRAFIRHKIEGGTFPALSPLHSNSWEISMAKKRTVTAPAQQLAQPFIFNPHILWDPPPWPWFDQLGAGVAQEMMLIRLQHQKDVLELQSKALDQAINVISKASG
jgi:hypothetical protein